MKLKELLKQKYGNLSQAAKELGFNQGDLHALVSKESFNPRLKTIQKLTTKGIICTVQGKEVEWNIE